MADRYWVGGSATWDGTAGTKWATTSGGTGGAAVPTSADNVYFDAYTSAAASIGIGANVSCKNLSFTSSAGNYAGTITGSSSYTITISGNLIISSSTNYLAACAILFNSTSAQTIQCSGKSIAGAITFNGVGGNWQLQDNLTISGSVNNQVTLTNGTLDLNNNTLTTYLFNSNNSNTRTIAFGTGNITIAGSASRVLDIRGVTGLTITGTPVINCNYSGATGTRTLETGPLPESSAITLNVTAGTDIVTNVASAAYKNLNFTGFSGTWNSAAIQTIYGNLTVSTGLTVGATTSNLTFAGTSGTQSITTNGKTLDRPLTFSGIGGTFAFQDALTQGSTKAFTIVNGTVKLKSGVTSTVGSFATSGSNQKYLQSTVAGSQATLSQASGTVTVSYLSIKDIAATGGATWNSYVDYNNVDQGDNTGWDFSYSPAIDNEFPLTLRSFTQPKRF